MAGSVVTEDHPDGLVFVLVEQAVRLAGHPDGEEEPIGAGTYRFARQETGFSVSLWPVDAPGPEPG